MATMLIIAVTGCKKDNDNDIIPNAPPLPPLSSLVMDFSEFDNPDDTIPGRDLSSYTNWGRSYVLVSAWNMAVTAVVAIPFASYAVALSQTPVYIPGTGAWVWAYDFTANSVVYSAELTGYYDGADSVAWEMRISQTGGYTDFLWYHGKMHIANNEIDYVNWIILDNPVNNNPFLKIDWTYFNNVGNESTSTTYTNINSASPGYHDFINFAVFVTDNFREFLVFDASEGIITDIEYYVDTREGRIKDPVFFLDEEWHCWDTNLMNVVCP
ncbi:hypothetical protein K8R42_02455 [bacterium]|nr:hypothetical protein [bacterium]